MSEAINSKSSFKALAMSGAAMMAVLGGVAAETVYHLEAHNAAGELLWTDTVKNRVVTAGLNKLLDATFKTGLTTPAWYVGLVGAAITDGAITTGTATFTSASAPFTAADAGRAIIVRGAGAAGADLVTTILSFGTTSSVTLAANAGTTVSGARALFDARAADTSASHTSWTELAAYSEANRQTFTAGTVASGSVDNSAAKAVFTINADNTLIGGLFLIDNNTKSGTTGTLYGMAPFTTVGFRQLNNGDTLSVTATLSVAAT